MKLETSDTEGEGVANSLQFTKDLFNELLLNPQQKYPLEDEPTTERSRRSTFHPWKRDQETQAPPPRATSLFSVTTGATLPGPGRYGGASCRPPPAAPPCLALLVLPLLAGRPPPPTSLGAEQRSFQAERGCALVPGRRCSGWGRGRGQVGRGPASPPAQEAPCKLAAGLGSGAGPSSRPRGPRPPARPRPAHLCGSSGAARAWTGPATAGRGGSGSCCRPPAASGGSAPPPGTPALGTQREVAGLHAGRPPAGQGPGSARSPRSARLFRSQPANCARRGGARAPRGRLPPCRPSQPSLRGPRLSGS